jgi:hypothetical protein
VIEADVGRFDVAVNDPRPWAYGASAISAAISAFAVEESGTFRHEMTRLLPSMGPSRCNDGAVAASLVNQHNAGMAGEPGLELRQESFVGRTVDCILAGWFERT